MPLPVGTGRALGVLQSNLGDLDCLATNVGSKAGFFGVTPVVQPASAVQAALTTVTGSAGGIGFTTTTNFSAFVAQVENIRASLVLLGLLKGGA